MICFYVLSTSHDIQSNAYSGSSETAINKCSIWQRTNIQAFLACAQIFEWAIRLTDSLPSFKECINILSLPCSTFTSCWWDGSNGEIPSSLTSLVSSIMITGCLEPVQWLSIWFHSRIWWQCTFLWWLLVHEFLFIIIDYSPGYGGQMSVYVHQLRIKRGLLTITGPSWTWIATILGRWSWSV